MFRILKRVIVFLALFMVSCSVRAASGAEDMDLATFKSTILTDEKVWLVEFYSGMCGSCKEFSATWSKVEKSMKSIATAKINIDNKGGMEIAKELGVLEEGIPNIRLFKSLKAESGRMSATPKGITIMTSKLIFCTFVMV
jgi:thioredoxin-like negative regulator of GroEL